MKERVKQGSQRICMLKVNSILTHMVLLLVIKIERLHLSMAYIHCNVKTI